MEDIFLLIFLLSPVLLLIGLLKPQIFKRLPIGSINRKKILGIFLLLMVGSFVGFGLTYEPNTATDTANNEEQTLGEDTQVSSIEVLEDTVKIKRVIDGDTVETENGNKIRYIGIDTPEMNPVECYAEEATKKNRELVEGKEVRLEKDISEKDKYGRLLRYLWINDVMINELLVREGYAQSSTYPPDVKYQDRFREAERLAREESKGLWGDVCSTPTPAKKPTSKPTAKPATKYHTPTPTTYVAPTTAPYVPPPQPTETSSGGGGSWTCDCSKTCPNMSSCDEAYFQLNNCRCSIRDGDNDGVPCESICPGG
jgi:micrococcal nuclease